MHQYTDGTPSLGISQRVLGLWDNYDITTAVKQLENQQERFQKQQSKEKKGEEGEEEEESKKKAEKSTSSRHKLKRKWRERRGHQRRRNGRNRRETAGDVLPQTEEGEEEEEGEVEMEEEGEEQEEDTQSEAVPENWEESMEAIPAREGEPEPEPEEGLNWIFEEGQSNGEAVEDDELVLSNEDNAEVRRSLFI